MLKFFGIVGLAGVSLATYMVTFGVGPERQLPPSVSLLEGFREDGFLPENLNLPNDHAAEEAGVFEVPAQDEVVLEAALEAMGDMDMGGMDMSGGDSSMEGMDMSGGGSSMEGMDMSGTDDTAMAGMDMSGSSDAVLDMDMDGDGVMDMSSAAMGGMSSMDMGSDSSNAMAGMDMAESDEAVLDMDMDGDGIMDMSSAAMSGMNMGSESSNAMAGMDMADIEMGEGGLVFEEDGTFDRVIDLTMQEWGYSDMLIDVQTGERIKFVVSNGGEIPHEFMFMSMPLMAAANYRGTRADWNLLEHEALFEQALILPGGDFEFIVEVQEAGSWMFMCMLPYHMQMGMMGQMATEGMAMDMNMAM